MLIAGVFLDGEAFSYSYNPSIFLRVMAVSLALGAAVRGCCCPSRVRRLGVGRRADSVAPCRNGPDPAFSYARADRSRRLFPVHRDILSRRAGRVRPQVQLVPC